MVFFIPEGVILGLEALGITAAAVGTAYLTYEAINQHLTILDAAHDVEGALVDINNWITDLVKAGLTANDWLAVNLYAALEDAYKTGTVLPSETSKAVAWVMALDKKTILTADYLTTGQIAAAFSLWAVHQGHTAHAATATTIPATKSVIYVGPVGEGINTPGGVMVKEAQDSLAVTHVTVPGLPAIQAQGVSKALAQSYANTMTTLVGVANSLNAEVVHVGTLVVAAHGAADAAYKLAEDNNAKLQATISTLNADITHLGNTINTLQAKVVTLEQAVSNVEGTEASIAATVAALPGVIAQSPPAPVTQTQGDIQSIPGGQALTDTVAGQGTELATIEGILAGLAAGSLAITLDDLARCCAANAAVTDPINSGGATASSLTQLGGLLAKVAAIGIVLGWLDTIYAILDLPAAIAQDVRGAEWIAPIVAATVVENFSDLSWTKQLAPAVA